MFSGQSPGGMVMVKQNIYKIYSDVEMFADYELFIQCRVDYDCDYDDIILTLSIGSDSYGIVEDQGGKIGRAHV